VFQIRKVASIVSRKNTERSEHRDDDRAKIAAHLGQNIFVARRVFAVAAALQKAGIDHGAQAARQHVGRDVQALLEFVKAREPVQGVANNQDAQSVRRCQMVDTSLTGMRCRATKEIRSHQGLVRRYSEGIIQYDMDNLGRHLISVQWDNGVIDYVYPLEIELLGQGDEPAFNIVN
jgi:hypothetical protein